MPDTQRSISTLLVHAGEHPDRETGAIAPPLVRTKTYRQPEFGKEAPWQYSRGKNPTRSILEEKLAMLEGGGKAAAFGSGCAAVSAFLLTLSPGDHILFCREIYGGTYRIVDQLLSRFGIDFSFSGFESAEEVLKDVRPNTKYLFVETPTNPSLHVIDLDVVRDASERSGIPFVVDATFAPPCTTRHFDHGAFAVIHSLSKYAAGHNDVIAGAVITKDELLYGKLAFMQRALGGILSPDECYRVIQGLKTLELRWNRVSGTAQKVAEFLSEKSSIKRVLYPGLASHPGHEIVKRQMRNGYGAVVSFELKEKTFEKIKSFVESLTASGLIVYAESLASPETILAYPPLMSHRALPQEERDTLGISEGFFRLSVGFEDPQEIIDELEKALAPFN